MSTRQAVEILKPLVNRADVPEDVQGKIAASIGNLRTPLQTDAWIYRAVVTFLGTVVLLTVTGCLFIVINIDANRTIPDFLVAIGSTAVGALAGLLAPSPSGA